MWTLSRLSRFQFRRSAGSRSTIRTQVSAGRKGVSCLQTNREHDNRSARARYPRERAFRRKPGISQFCETRSRDIHCPFSNFGIFMWMCWTFRCYLTERGTDVVDEWYREQPEALQAKFDTRCDICGNTRVPIGYVHISTRLGGNAQV